jgi:hypothetical protein
MKASRGVLKESSNIYLFFWTGRLRFSSLGCSIAQQLTVPAAQERYAFCSMACRFHTHNDKPIPTEQLSHIQILSSTNSP